MVRGFRIGRSGWMAGGPRVVPRVVPVGSRVAPALTRSHTHALTLTHSHSHTHTLTRSHTHTVTHTAATGAVALVWPAHSQTRIHTSAHTHTDARVDVDRCNCDAKCCSFDEEQAIWAQVAKSIVRTCTQGRGVTRGPSAVVDPREPGSCASAFTSAPGGRTPWAAALQRS